MNIKENPEWISFTIGLIFTAISILFIVTTSDIFIIFLSIGFIFWGYSFYRFEMDSELDIGDFIVSTIFLLIIYIITLLFIILSMRFGEISWSAILFFISLWIMYILFYYPHYLSYKEFKKANQLVMKRIIKEYIITKIRFIIVISSLPIIIILYDIFKFVDLILIYLIIAWMILSMIILYPEM